MTVAGKAYPQLFGQLAALNDSLRAVHPLQHRENRPNSDHYPFTQVGVPSLFFYTQGGPPHYHDVHDLPDAFAYPVFWRFRRLIAEYLQR
jgi:Zn-dependent M28 family amino/carboxypeptidase